MTINANGDPDGPKELKKVPEDVDLISRGELSENIEFGPQPDGVDGRAKRSIWSKFSLGNKAEDKHQESFASKKTAAEGMMDIALLTANANQLRFLFAYNTESKTYYMSVSLIIASLILQVAVGIMLIFKRQMKNRGQRASWTNDFLVTGVFLITVINVFAASFTTTHASSHNHQEISSNSMGAYKYNSVPESPANSVVGAPPPYKP